MDATTLIAWIGAITGTSSLTWEFIKWRLSGPRLRIELIPNTSYSNAILASEEYAWMRVVNTGQRTFTLIKLVLGHYPSRRAKILKQTGLEVQTYCTDLEMLPKVIDPGVQWNGLVRQTEEFKKFLKCGFLYCEVHHSLKSKPLIKRVLVRDPYFAPSAVDKSH
jgi:hypothetical protein